MNNYQEFYFLKNWQRLLVLSMAVGLISVMRVLFLGQNSSIIILLIGALLAIWFATTMFKNKKIIINDDFITIENYFFLVFGKNILPKLIQKFTTKPNLVLW